MTFEASTLTPRKCASKTRSRYILQTVPLILPLLPNTTPIARTTKTTMPTVPRTRPRRRPKRQTNPAPGGPVPPLQVAFPRVYLGLKVVMLFLTLMCFSMCEIVLRLLLHAMEYPLHLSRYLLRVHLLLAQQLLRLLRELIRHLPIEISIRL